MKKVFVAVKKLNEEQKKRIESVSDQFQIVYTPDEDADIIIGNYKPEQLIQFKQLDWIQLTAVGYDAFIKKGLFAKEVTITNAVDVHSQEVAEHLLGLLMMLIKKLYLYRDNQSKHIWNDEGKVKAVAGLRVCIVGLGDIGNNLARTLKGMGMYVIGVKRTMIEKPAYVDELYTNVDLKKAISNVDAVVTVLPGTKENVHLFDEEVLKTMRSDTVLVNGGRGNLIDTDLLIKALKEKWIEAVAMDVFEQEPIDPNSELWNIKNLMITPHVAGYFHLDAALEKYVDLVCENMRRYSEHEELLYVVKERE